MTSSSSALHQQITAVILAGGRGRRMGGADKGLVEFCNKPLIQQVIERIRPQVDTILINANRNTADYENFGYPVIADSVHDYQGPLAGFLAAMEAVKTEYIACVPCDGPSLSGTLVARLMAQLSDAKADIAVAHDGQRMQPVYVLLKTRLKDSLKTYLASGERKIDQWYAQHKVAIVDFSDTPETFVNINTRQQRDDLERERSAA